MSEENEMNAIENTHAVADNGGFRDVEIESGTIELDGPHIHHRLSESDVSISNQLNRVS